MPKVWNLGNTTVRNPNRIEEGLKLFAEEFQGNVHGEEAEARFWRRLGEEGIISSQSIDKATQAFYGRKWRNVLVKLGFATNISYGSGRQRFTPHDLSIRYPDLELQGLEYELTPAGNHLLEANTIGAIQDVYLRQLVRHEISSPIESGFPRGRLKPFIFILQVLLKLREFSQPGLNKMEAAIFLQLFADHTDELVDMVVNRILDYRREHDLLDGRTAKREFENRLLVESGRLGGISGDSLVDYADTSFRYSQMSGLVTSQGSRLILREDKIEIIRSILDSEPSFMAREDPSGYLADFYRGTHLPTDDVDFALQEIQRLIETIQGYGVTPQITSEDIPGPEDIHGIERARFTLIEQLALIREEQFANNQTQVGALEETLSYLDALIDPRRNPDLIIFDRPTYLEWSVWRGFLAIDNIVNPISSTRRFPLDDNLLPRHTAPGGGSDMVFEFEHFILAVEVTLTGSTRQLVAEGEPVRRHIADLKIDYPDKEVYGLFIAPSVENNTAETFRIGVWYRDEQVDYVNIVPITLVRFRQIIDILRNRRFSPDDFQRLLDRCLIYRNVKAPEWKRQIEIEANRWISQFRV